MHTLRTESGLTASVVQHGLWSTAVPLPLPCHTPVTPLQKEYLSEGIVWSHVDYRDNQPCLDLICKRPDGILVILDDESNFPKVIHTFTCVACECYQCAHVHIGLLEPCLPCRPLTVHLWTSVTSSMTRIHTTRSQRRGCRSLLSTTMQALSGTM